VDGQFRMPRPDTALRFTGERMTSDIAGQIAFEHYHRYCLARDLVSGLDVLDVAAGEGYGSALLAGVARSVVGVEIDPDSVRHAQEAYRFRNLRFVQGDAAQMPLPDNCVDVVVSFETLEHLPDQEKFLSEVRRVLRPGGLFLVSTPDRLVYSAPGQPPNPYHVLELTGPEFSELLTRHFTNHRILAQRAMIGSVLAPLDEAGTGWRTYDSREEGLIEAQPGLSRAFYLLGIASDSPLPPIGSSAFAHNVSLDDMLAAPARLAAEAQARMAAEAAAEAARAALDSDTSARERRAQDAARAAAEAAAEAGRAAAAARTELAQKEAALAVAQREVSELLARIEQIRTSTSWRLTGPLRVAARHFPDAARFCRRGLRAAWWTVTGQLPRRLSERRAALAAAAAAGTPDLAAVTGLPRQDRPPPAPADIRLPVATGAPRVSVIIPSYGQVDYTLRCLASIADHPPATPFEVIVADDASSDQAVAGLAEVQGLRLVVWPENKGFLRSCNAAAALARGEFLFLLNNDTELMPGAADALVRLLDARPDAAAAGSKLLYPDGFLQEAGGIIWRDGSGWNYGNRDDPRKHQYSYVREADYISGAALMIRRADWDAMGGFDEAFLPAYCEDSDLAFRLRAAGRKVLFQPRSVVIHHEGVSHGTDLSAGVKAHQVANTLKLFERWHDTLAREALPSGQRVMRARDRAAGRRITLVVDHYVPEPDRDAGSRTMFAFLEALVAAGRCVKFLPANLHRTPRYADDLEQRGIEVIHAPWTPSIEAWLAENGAEVDEILLSRPSVAKDLLAPLRRHCRAPIVFYGHDLHFARMMLAPGAMDSAERRQEIAATQAQERQTWRLVDVVLYPSEDEAAKVRELEPTVRARAVPAYALPPRAAPKVVPPAAGGLIFVGGFRHPPNVDAASWLAKEIFPLVRAQVPETTLTILGSHPTSEVLALGGAGIEVRGFVPDEELAAAYARARVAVCPLRVGAGVKLKVVEAMHRGLPVVTTPVGAQGLPGLAEVCDVADDAAGLAAATVRLLTDDALWLRRAEEQAGYVAARFSPEALRDALAAAFADAARTGA
jgi:GT2 family glycosyltransferase/SAM-dependent methyltransferase/glycosyltransferase involved in cell wall biosynthesis